jgi:hypothetical protein
MIFDLGCPRALHRRTAQKGVMHLLQTAQPLPQALTFVQNASETLQFGFLAETHIIGFGIFCALALAAIDGEAARQTAMQHAPAIKCATLIRTSPVFAVPDDARRHLRLH